MQHCPCEWHLLGIQQARFGEWQVAREILNEGSLSCSQSPVQAMPADAGDVGNGLASAA
jgi:hypothetical protein